MVIAELSIPMPGNCASCRFCVKAESNEIFCNLLNDRITEIHKNRDKNCVLREVEVHSVALIPK